MCRGKPFNCRFSAFYSGECCLQDVGEYRGTTLGLVEAVAGHSKIRFQAQGKF